MLAIGGWRSSLYDLGSWLAQLRRQQGLVILPPCCLFSRLVVPLGSLPFRSILLVADWTLAGEIWTFLKLMVS
jgi:hypothetical protein